MAFAVSPYLHRDIESYISLAVLVACLIVEVVAFVHCLTQRADAFPVVGSLSKPAWLAILGGTMALTLCTSGLLFGKIDVHTVGVSFFAFIAIIAAGVYMLDVRPALRDVTNGSGSW